MIVKQLTPAATAATATATAQTLHLSINKLVTLIKEKNQQSFFFTNCR